jgi:hypothetical protein
MYEFKVCKPAPQLFHPDKVAELPAALANTEQILREHLTSIGYPQELWPLTVLGDSVLTTVLRFGSLPINITLNMPFDNTPIDEKELKPFHPFVRDRFNQQFQYHRQARYCFTRAEEWWKGEPMFLVSDAHSLLLFLQYELSQTAVDVRDYAPKQRGRPRNVEKHIAKEQKSGKYQQWIADCQAYRQHLVDEAEALKLLEEQLKIEAQLILDNARESIACLLAPLSQRQEELKQLKAQGAPKWIP